VNFDTGLLCQGGSASNYTLSGCSFFNNKVAVSLNTANVASNNCLYVGAASFAGPINNTAITVTGSSSMLTISGGTFTACSNGLVCASSAYVTVSGVSFKFNEFDVSAASSSTVEITGSTFILSSSSTDLKVDASGSGTTVTLNGCILNGFTSGGVVKGSGVHLSRA
jgi:hypothetical protein